MGHGRSAMTRTGDEVEEVDGKVTRAWRTPFEVEAAKEGLRYKGGKVDECVHFAFPQCPLTWCSITVVTAVVSEQNPEQ